MVRRDGEDRGRRAFLPQRASSVPVEISRKKGSGLGEEERGREVEIDRKLECKNANRFWDSAKTLPQEQLSNK